MKKEKRLKKFNISNRLAYTLMVILSIALLGIGVWAAAPNPGHSANELELDWGSKSFCEGSVNPCDSLTPSQCSSQSTCYMSCTGSGGYVSCSAYTDESICRDHGCMWEGSSRYCYGSGGETVSCSSFYSQSDCDRYTMVGCYWGCSGNAHSCSTFTNPTYCNRQSGCKWVTRQRSITSNDRGINISNLQVNSLCDISGSNCVQVRGKEASKEGNYNTGDDSTRRMRINQYASCPTGYYVSAVRSVPYSASTSALRVTCTPLPIR